MSERQRPENRRQGAGTWPMPSGTRSRIALSAARRAKPLREECERRETRIRARASEREAFYEHELLCGGYANDACVRVCACVRECV